MGSITIDNEQIRGVTIDGVEIGEITIDNEVVFKSKIVVDNFQRGNLDPYDGATDEWEITDNSEYVREGDYAIIKSSDRAGLIYSTSGLSRYPQQGDTFRYWVYPFDLDWYTVRLRVYFGVQDEDNHYYIWFGFQGWVGNIVELELYKRENGKTESLERQTVEVEDVRDYLYKWYEIIVDWRTDGTINVKIGGLKEEIEINVVDNTFTGGGIGFLHPGDGKMSIDSVEII